MNWGIQIGARVLSISKVLRKYEMKKKNWRYKADRHDKIVSTIAI